MQTSLDPPSCAILRQRGWLSGQPAPFQSALLARCRRLCVQRGNVLYRRGEAPGGVYGLVEGGLAYVFPQAEDEAHLVHIGLPGSWIGEAALLLEGPRVMTLKALAPSTVAFLPVRAFQELAAVEPYTWQAFAVLAAEHQVAAARIISELLPQTPMVRLAGRILGLAEHEPGVDRAAIVTLPVTQSELATMVGLSRPTVNKLLGELVARGGVELGYGRIDVRDAAVLVRIVDGGH